MHGKHKEILSRKLTTFLDKDDVSIPAICWVFTSLYLECDPDTAEYFGEKVTKRKVAKHLEKKAHVLHYDNHGHPNVVVTNETPLSNGFIIACKYSLITDLLREDKLVVVDRTYAHHYRNGYVFILMILFFEKVAKFYSSTKEVYTDSYLPRYIKEKTLDERVKRLEEQLNKITRVLK